MLPFAVGAHVRSSRCRRRARSAGSPFIGFAIALALLALTFVVGAEIKGARRWINLPGLSLQPSEFVKPTFAVVAAWLFAEQKLQPGLSRQSDLRSRCFLLIVAMLIKQPDLGMAVVVAAVLVRAVLHGRAAALLGRRRWRSPASAGSSAPISCCRMSRAGSTASSIPRPATATRSTARSRPSPMAGCGAAVRAKARSRTYLPDAHADFVFAVAGEEFGLDRLPRRRRALSPSSCCAASRGCLQEGSLFVLLAATGLLMQFGLAGGHQHGLDPAPDPDQGHDLAVPVLWRLVDAGARHRHGHDAGADPAPARRRASCERSPFVLAAGGTGGHLFPAEALAERAGRRAAHTVHLADRSRAPTPLPPTVPGIEVAPCARRPARRRAGPTPPTGLAELAIGDGAGAAPAAPARRPHAVVGFGGYPSVPTMLAAISARLPTVIHEQNAVLGRANRLLAPRVRRIATGFPDTAEAARRRPRPRRPYRQPGAAGDPAPSATCPIAPPRARRSRSSC